MTPYVEFDRIAVTETLRLVRSAGASDWGRPTPCAGWTLGDLVAHMTAQNRGFAAAARGEGGLAAYWRVPEAGSGPVDAYGLSVAALIAPFAEGGGTEAAFVLPELGGAFPARVAVSFHLLDAAVHAWDVAVTLGTEPQLPLPVWESVLRIARRIPDGNRAPFFGPALRPHAGDGDPVTSALKLLGRDPHWSPDDQEPPQSL
ncbi:TIGR03086 family metal-binding protein [Streptomyces sp. NPDC050418]|uniref:TIGR03086 family metal-binding protein n=1 Tax=Streptomyces sp. NPDC050418 TaxID=3365612 RepID=UPI003789E442